MSRKDFTAFQKSHYILTILIGALAGHFLLHPFSDLVSSFIIKHSASGWRGLETTTLHALGLREFSLAYSVFGALLGYFYARTVGMQRQQIIQLQRFSRIGMNASSIIHDLGNPLTGISWFAGLIERKTGESECRDYARMIKKSVEEISKMMLDIKTLANESNKLTLSCVHADLYALAQKVASSMALHCSVVFTAEDPVYGTIDPAYFERVLWNLFKNADEAMGGKPDARLEISIWKEKSAVNVRIRDNGPGIPPALAKEILSFGVTYGKKGGSGIGLYNCDKIIQAHGGKLWFTSVTGRGTSFFIRIPEYANPS